MSIISKEKWITYNYHHHYLPLQEPEDEDYNEQGSSPALPLDWCWLNTFSYSIYLLRSTLERQYVWWQIQRSRWVVGGCVLPLIRIQSEANMKEPLQVIICNCGRLLLKSRMATRCVPISSDNASASLIRTSLWPETSPIKWATKYDDSCCRAQTISLIKFNNPSCAEYL